MTNKELIKALESFSRPVCYNCNDVYAVCDQFICSECGIEIRDWVRVEHDFDDLLYHEYTFKYCPNCGSRIIECDDNKKNKKFIKRW